MSNSYTDTVKTKGTIKKKSSNSSAVVIYPHTTADIVEFDNSKTVLGTANIDNVEAAIDTLNSGVARFSGNISSGDILVAGNDGQGATSTVITSVGYNISELYSIASGATKTFVASYWDFGGNLDAIVGYQTNAETHEREEVVVDIPSGTPVNPTQAQAAEFVALMNYINTSTQFFRISPLVTGTTLKSEDGNTVTQATFGAWVSAVGLRRGDIILMTEQELPDMWYGGTDLQNNHIFYPLESRSLDLTPYAEKKTVVRILTNGASRDDIAYNAIFIEEDPTSANN